MKVIIEAIATHNLRLYLITREIKGEFERYHESRLTRTWGIFRVLVGGGAWNKLQVSLLSK